MTLASLSLDLDNAWSYLKTHGEASWSSYPTYLDVVVPRILEILDSMRLRMTFFIVGQDAALESNRNAMAAIGASPHEVGCHSFHHEPWLHLYSEADLERELAEAEEHITAATGRRPDGFRGPGFSLSETTLRVLLRRGYRFDASTLPTFIGPLARAYYFMTARLDPEERRKRAALFGGVRDGLRSLRPYYWDLDEGHLLELPVTTFPGLRVPIHASYVLYLSTFSETLAWTYLRAALAACARSGLAPSILLHPLDFLSGDDAPGLAFFPAMAMPRETKLARIRRYLEMLAERFTVVTMGEHARAAAADPKLPLRPPHFDLAEGGADARPRPDPTR